MSKEYWTDTDVVEWLRENGYDLKPCYDGYFYEDDWIYLVVFDEDFEHPELGGSVAAESRNTFNKWTQAYYIKPYPQTKSAREKMLAALEVVGNEFHTERADQFYRWDDELVEKRVKQKHNNRSRQ